MPLVRVIEGERVAVWGLLRAESGRGVRVLVGTEKEEGIIVGGEAAKSTVATVGIEATGERVACGRILGVVGGGVVAGPVMAGVGTAKVSRELEAGGEVWTGLGIPGSVAGPGNAIGMAGVAIEVELRGDDIGPGSWGY